MKIGYGSNSGIQGFRDLGIEGILSLNASIPKSLNLAQMDIDRVQKI